MARIIVNSELLLVNGAVIKNASIESLPSELSGDDLNKSTVGRIYYNEKKEVFEGVFEIDGNKVVKYLGSYPYEPNTSSPILSAATSLQEADELLEVQIINLLSELPILEARVSDLESGKGLVAIYNKTDSLTSHTFKHDLNSDFIDCQVWVKDPDTNIFKNDIVSIVEVDKNTVQIELTEPRVVKIICRKAKMTE